MIEFTEEQSKVIRRAIELVRLYEPNPIIRERADAYVLMHVIPINYLVTVTDKGVSVSDSVISHAFISSDDAIPEGLRPKGEGRLRFGGLFRKYTISEGLYMSYVNLLIDLLHFFDGSLVCRHVIDHLAWSYDELLRGSSLISRITEAYGDGTSTDKALDALSRSVVVALVDFKMHKEALRGLSYETCCAINGVAGGLRRDELFAILEANEDYFYMGILKARRAQ